VHPASYQPDVRNSSPGVGQILRHRETDASCTMMEWLNKTTVYDDRIVVSTPVAHHVLTMTQRT
jgi:hypothetical protein